MSRKDAAPRYGLVGPDRVGKAAYIRTLRKGLWLRNGIDTPTRENRILGNRMIRIYAGSKYGR